MESAPWAPTRYLVVPHVVPPIVQPCHYRLTVGTLDEAFIIESEAGVKPKGYGRLLEQYRKRYCLTQREVAEKLASLAWTQDKKHIGIDSQMVSKWERELKFPNPYYRRLLCLLFGASEQDLGFRPSLGAIVVPPGLEMPSAIHATGESDGLESPLDIAERMQSLIGSNTSEEALHQLEHVVELVVDEYENSGPKELARRVVQQRRRVDQLLGGQQKPVQRNRLYRTAAKLSGLLGYMAVNLGNFPAAGAYCAEAFEISKLLGDKDLQAWIRGTESFCAYYQGDYRRAVDLAQDGQRYAGNGPQSIRLAANGEARALAKLGDEHGVDKAVERAFETSSRFELPEGVTPCISFGLYSLARTASNAATAYVGLRKPDRVREYAEQTMPVFEASRSRWSQSLLRLDMASALVTADRPDPERGAQLVTEALMISAERPITSVLQRGHEFLIAADRWSKLPPVRQAAETMRAAERR